MRVSKTGSNGAPTVKAYAGTTGVLLAFNLPKAKTANLLGFAIERTDLKTGQRDWLKGSLGFQGADHPAGASIDTKDAPIQKFRWSDYRVYEGCEYEYRVHAAHGTPSTLTLSDPTVVRAKTHGSGDGKHTVLFNRAAAASQAFARRFPDLTQRMDAAKKKTSVKLSDDALEWLSRGALELLLSFIARAKDAGWALDVAIYEYELPAIAKAIAAAQHRGANVRLVYHAKTGDDQTTENQHTLNVIGPTGAVGRVTRRIFHDKFIVLSRISAAGKRTPKAVLCGSMNFTENGVYRQANVLHIADDADIAGSYAGIFEQIVGGSTPAETRDWIDQNNTIDTGAAVFAGFSPRSGKADLTAFAKLIGAARRDVIFCTAFDLDPAIDTALLGKAKDKILRYGLENTKTSVTGVHADRNARFVATAMLNKGLEGFLRESLAGQRGRLLVHTKMVIVDFTSDAPSVLSGSHNLSAAASGGNDENFLIIRNNSDVADCYGVELMRLYDHYRFRWYVKEHPNDKKRGLFPDNRWTKDYYGGDAMKTKDREHFAGT
jgi:phosphatidylserine/phosphatidylglycerophosphate/cardiolipin synthase-like enzyme